MIRKEFNIFQVGEFLGTEYEKTLKFNTLTFVTRIIFQMCAVGWCYPTLLPTDAEELHGELPLVLVYPRLKFLKR